jgi:hypothetical protein
MKCVLVIVIPIIFGTGWLVIFIRSFIRGGEVGCSGVSVSRKSSPFYSKILLARRIFEGLLVVGIGILFWYKICLK